MNENPYESPRELCSPSLQANPSVTSPNRLRTFGVFCGFTCVGAFFALMSYLWRKSNSDSPLLNDPRFQYLVLGGVVVVFLGGIIGLVAIVFGNARSSGQRMTSTPGNPIVATAGNLNVPYAGWIIVGIIGAVICLLGWLVSRDPLAVRPG